MPGPANAPARPRSTSPAPASTSVAAPFGYQADRVTVLNARRQPRRRVRLVIDPGPATAVAAIYRWRVDDLLTPSSIVARLSHVHGLFPALLDAATGTPRPWTRDTIGRILTNPVYTGAIVWGRTSAGQPVPPEQWTICPHAHEPIIDGRTFHRAQLLATPGTGVFSPQLPPWKFPYPDGQNGDNPGRGPAA